MAAAAAEEGLWFVDMDEAELQQWVEADPGRVNARDGWGYTPLFVAVREMESLALTVWLLDEKGADVNATTSDGTTAVHVACRSDILAALFDRGADPTRLNDSGWSTLMWQARYGTVESVACLLQDPRVRATVDMQDKPGRTALHWACDNEITNATTASIVNLLLQAGGNPTLLDNHGKTPSAYLRQHRPAQRAAIALLEQTLPDAEKASLFVKARRLAVAANSNTVMPSYLQARVERGQPFPRLAPDVRDRRPEQGGGPQAPHFDGISPWD